MHPSLRRAIAILAPSSVLVLLQLVMLPSTSAEYPDRGLVDPFVGLVLPFVLGIPTGALAASVLCGRTSRRLAGLAGVVTGVAGYATGIMATGTIRGEVALAAVPSFVILAPPCLAVLALATGLILGAGRHRQAPTPVTSETIGEGR
jgi:hypothetical protein